MSDLSEDLKISQLELVEIIEGGIIIPPSYKFFYSEAEMDDKLTLNKKLTKLEYLMVVGVFVGVLIFSICMRIYIICVWVKAIFKGEK